MTNCPCRTPAVPAVRNFEFSDGFQFSWEIVNKHDKKIKREQNFVYNVYVTLTPVTQNRRSSF